MNFYEPMQTNRTVGYANIQLRDQNQCCYKISDNAAEYDYKANFAQDMSDVGSS